MRLKAFKESEKKNNNKYIIMGCIMLFLIGIFTYQSYAMYKDKKSFDMVKENIPKEEIDSMISYYVEDSNGKQTYSSTMPSGKNYNVTVSCDKGATGSWNYETWGPLITNLKESKTKCKIIFVPGKSLTETIKLITPVTTGTGLYSVGHSDAEITYTTDTTAINNLKQTELRYAGTNPNNYVTFNGEEVGWRIIGLVNTPEGQRVKLVRNESIGDYVWDSSDSSVNSGLGINEWSQADLMTLLNNGPYYNRTSGTCYNGSNNQTTSCNFFSTGLTTEAKNMIDTVTWNTGATLGYSSVTTNQYYNYERSSNTGKICSEDTYCNDLIPRTTSWKGQVALIYPSDYGYATSGGTTTNRSTCLSNSLGNWVQNGSECPNNDWLYNSGISYRLLTPSDGSASILNYKDTFIIYVGYASASVGETGYSYVFPSVYLKTTIRVKSGDGTQSNPYVLVS